MSEGILFKGRKIWVKKRGREREGGGQSSTTCEKQKGNLFRFGIETQ